MGNFLKNIIDYLCEEVDEDDEEEHYIKPAPKIPCKKKSKKFQRDYRVIIVIFIMIFLIYFSIKCGWDF